MERVQASLRVVFDELGYPDDKSLGELRDLASTEAGVVSGDDIVAEYERLISEAELLFGPYFPTAPSSEVVVVPFPGQGAFYIAPTVDGSRPGSFHTGTGGGQVRRLTMPTIAYHETVPGHHWTRDEAVAEMARIMGSERTHTRSIATSYIRARQRPT